MVDMIEMSEDEMRLQVLNLVQTDRLLSLAIPLPGMGNPPFISAWIVSGDLRILDIGWMQASPVQFVMARVFVVSEALLAWRDAQSATRN